MAHHSEELPENVYLLRQASMWASSRVHSTFLRLLRHCLRRLLRQNTYEVILFAHAFAGHLTAESMQAMRSYGFWFKLLPAGLTWSMQLLDVQTVSVKT